MAFNLGNYSNELTVDDYNKALANSGYHSQAQPQFQGAFDPATASNPYDTGVSATPVRQASDRERPPGYANGQYYGGRHSNEQEPKKENKLGNILGIVGKIAAFL